MRPWPDWIADLPRAPGTYLLHLRLTQPRLLRIGRLGEHSLPAGEYVYLGSACGPGGLRARLGRHLRGEGQIRWHIDFLRRATEVGGFGFSTAPKPSSPGDRLECRWSQHLAALVQAGVPIPGFGSSDCRAIPNRCPAHLILFPATKEPLLPGLLASGNLPADPRFPIITCY